MGRRFEYRDCENYEWCKAHVGLACQGCDRYRVKPKAKAKKDQER